MLKHRARASCSVFFSYSRSKVAANVLRNVMMAIVERNAHQFARARRCANIEAKYFAQILNDAQMAKCARGAQCVVIVGANIHGETVTSLAKVAHDVHITIRARCNQRARNITINNDARAAVQVAQNINVPVGAHRAYYAATNGQLARHRNGRINIATRDAEAPFIINQVAHNIEIAALTCLMKRVYVIIFEVCAINGKAIANILEHITVVAHHTVVM